MAGRVVAVVGIAAAHGGQPPTRLLPRESKRSSVPPFLSPHMAKAPASSLPGPPATVSLLPSLSEGCTRPGEVGSAENSSALLGRSVLPACGLCHLCPCTALALRFTYILTIAAAAPSRSLSALLLLFCIACLLAPHSFILSSSIQSSPDSSVACLVPAVSALSCLRSFLSRTQHPAPVHTTGTHDWSLPVLFNDLTTPT